uniref:DnaJ homolog subfamily C member 8 n=1 Tax=Myripristis murdjan TaxID=586833 RepID=A0A667ZYB9_9TELE
MAAAGGEPSAQSCSDELFQSFYTEVKQIEKRDSVLTSKQQIDRLLRPGSSYFNLNPFEVLQIDPDATDEELKKRFRALSILVHPDKNQDDPDRAQQAFEAVDKAYKLLLDGEQKKRAVDVINAGKEYVEHMMKEKRKQLKKDGKPLIVEEDDPEVFKQAVYKQTMKLFAELEIKRKEREAKEMHERKRAREEEIETAERAKREREWQKNFEVRCLFYQVTNGKILLSCFLVICESPFLHFSLSRKQEMVVLIVGGTSRLKAKLKRRRKTGPSSSPPKSRWNRENDAQMGLHKTTAQHFQPPQRSECPPHCQQPDVCSSHLS